MGVSSGGMTKAEAVTIHNYIVNTGNGDATIVRFEDGSYAVHGRRTLPFTATEANTVAGQIPGGVAYAQRSLFSK